MEIIKTTESRSQIYAGIFFPVTLTVKKKIHQQHCLSNRQGLLSMEFIFIVKVTGKKYISLTLTPRFCPFNSFH